MYYVKSERSYFLFAPPLTPTTGPPQTIPHPRDQRAGLVLGGNGNRSNWTIHHVGVSLLILGCYFWHITIYYWHVLIQLGNKIELGGITILILLFITLTSYLRRLPESEVEDENKPLKLPGVLASMTGTVMYPDEESAKWDVDGMC